MTNSMLRFLVRSQFILSSRNRVRRQTEKILQHYQMLAEELDNENDGGSRCIAVPPMPGVDKDMRNWSFYMILEHNNIVNRTITAIVEQLSCNESLSGAAAINPKTEVMPSKSAGKEQLEIFTQSVHNHIQVVRGLGKLRYTRTAPHPIFGDFDAHKWNCMLPFHLKLHYRQAEFVVQMTKEK